MLFLLTAVLPRVVKCRQGKVSAWTLVLVSQEAAVELSIVTSVGKCFFLISGQQFATKILPAEAAFSCNQLGHS